MLLSRPLKRSYLFSSVTNQISSRELSVYIDNTTRGIFAARSSSGNLLLKVSVTQDINFSGYLYSLDLRLKKKENKFGTFEKKSIGCCKSVNFEIIFPFSHSFIACGVILGKLVGGKRPEGK